MNLLDAIREEQILNLALNHVCERDEDKIDPIAERICVFYAMKQLEKELPYDPTDEEIHKRYSEMIVEKMIENLASKGLVEVNFGNDNIGYEITDEGKEILNGNQMLKDD